MNIKKHISIRNWEKYQSRTDKKMPWCKLWGMIFDEEWWQELGDDKKVIPFVFLDVARKFCNRCPQNYEYYARNYKLSWTKDEWVLACNLLKDNGFLSDLPQNYLGQHKRIEENREELEAAPPPSEPVDNSKLEKLQSLCVKIKTLHGFHKIYAFLEHLKKHRGGEYPPIDASIKVLESVLKNKPKGNWWPYLVMAFRKEIPQYYAKLSAEYGQKLKKELDESAGGVLRSIMERKL